MDAWKGSTMRRRGVGWVQVGQGGNTLAGGGVCGISGVARIGLIDCVWCCPI